MAALLIGGYVTSKAPIPLHPPATYQISPSSKQQAKQTGKEQHRTAPPIVQQTPSSAAGQALDQRDRNRSKEGEQRPEGDQPKITDWIQGFSAGVSAFFSFCLLMITVRQIRIADRQAKIMADQLKAAEIAATAAQISAETLIKLERPWLVPKAEQTSFTERIEALAAATDPDPEPLTVEIPIVFTNEGKTTAFLKLLHSETVIAEYPKPISGIKLEVNYSGSTVSPGDPFDVEIGFGITIYREDAINLLTTFNEIWYFGYLQYSDFFGKTHYSYFCYIHSSAIGCVMPWGGDKENYLT